jgi:acyl-CoA synthetase (AMP-forming)/AMP-acid ligase II
VRLDWRPRADIGTTGLDYIVAFLGTMQAGQIAVPLSVPLGGVSDERVSSVLGDASPSVILATSPLAGTVAEYVKSQSGASAPSVVEVDLLDLDGPTRSGAGFEDLPSTAYLQYTSGSTRQPAGVMMSHGNVLANFEQATSDYFAHYGKVAPPDTTLVSWLPFYHDMGLYLGICAPVLLGVLAVLMSPVAFLQRPARWMQLLASNSKSYSIAPNFAFELAARKTSDDDMAGLDLSDVLGIGIGSERVHPATLPWLRIADLGFFFDDELFIIGRIKDLLIVYGGNHSPDDIEATIQEITRGRCAAIAVPDEGTEQLVVIIEVKKRGESHEEAADQLTVVKREVTSAISNSHGLSVADLVLVAPGSIPITTSGKIRRAACVEQYRHRQFARLEP